MISSNSEAEITISFTVQNANGIFVSRRVTIRTNNWNFDYTAEPRLPQFGTRQAYKINHASFKMEGELLDFVEEEVAPRASVQIPPKNGKSKPLLEKRDLGDWTTEERELITRWLQEKKKVDVVDPTKHYTQEEIEAMEA